MDSSSEISRSPPDEKVVGTQDENVKTNEPVPGHPGYYEKGGLRTYGDDEDHDHEPPVCQAATIEIPTEADDVSDELQEVHVPGRHGLPLDWLSDPGLHLRWHSTTDLQRNRRLGQMDLVCPRPSSCPRSSMPLRWLSLRSHGAPIRRHTGCNFDHCRCDCSVDRTQYERPHW